MLAGLTALAASHLPGVDHARVTLMTEDDVIRCPAANDGHPLVLDNVQRGCGQGPCLDASTEHHVVRIDDLTGQSRWPAFTARAADATPVRAILTLPVLRDGSSSATLNLYADRRRALDARTGPPGHSRSPRSTVINQAETLLMRDFDMDGAQAYALLVKLAKQQNDSIEAVARQVVAADGPSGRN